MADYREGRNNLRACKRDSTIAAKQLCYSPQVLKRIKDAKTTSEVYRIMLMARRGDI